MERGWKRAWSTVDAKLGREAVFLFLSSLCSWQLWSLCSLPELVRSLFPHSDPRFALPLCGRAGCELRNWSGSAIYGNIVSNPSPDTQSER